MNGKDKRTLVWSARGRNLLVGLGLIGLIGLAHPLPAAEAVERSGNPVFDGWYADPEGTIIRGEYWIFPTYSAPYDQQLHFDAFSSPDLVNWTKHENVLTNQAVSWVRRAMWAPAIVEKDGKFFLFFGANDIHDPKKEVGGIGVAVADNPAGPYKDYLGKPLIGEIHNGAQPIDQFVFKDVNGQYYMIYGGWSHCNIARLKDDFTGFLPFEDGTTFREITPEGYVEGPFMFRKDGRYYFMWSEGGWTGPNYSVAYAIADSPLGPFKRIGKVLQQDPQVGTGAGHHSVIHDEQADIWYAVYHRRPLTETDGNHRVTCIDRMTFDEKGLIQPIKITKEGVEKRTLLKPQAGAFTNPLNDGADPWMVYHEGNYYLTTTQRNCIRMWKAPTLEGLKTAKGVTVWKDDDPSRSDGVWAPEIHFIDGKWYLYYTAMAATKVDTTHRMHVLESAGTDPLGPYTYKGRIFDKTNDQYAIDGSVFQNPGDGKWYFLWAAHPGHLINIARMENPWTLATPGVVIPASGFGAKDVREAPVVLKRNGKLFLVYSAADTGTPDYKLGMLIADEKADLLNPASWKQHPTPSFERNDEAGVFGPGHNGFFQSPDGKEDWIVYHAKTTSKYTYSGRTTRAQKFTWNEDGTPNFGKPLSLDTVLEEPSSK